MDPILGNILAEQGANVGANLLSNVGTDAILNQGMMELGSGVMQNGIGVGAENIIDPSNYVDSPGFFSDKGNVNALNLGLKGLGLANTYMGSKEAMKASRQNRRLSADAYQRNVDADERRQKLNF